MIQPGKNHLKNKTSKYSFGQVLIILTSNPQGGARRKSPVVFLEFPPIPRPWPGSIAATTEPTSTCLLVTSPLSNWYFWIKERQISILFGVDMGWLSKYFYFKTSFSFNSPMLLWIHVGLIFSCLDGMGWDRDHPRVFLKVGPIGRVRLCDANPLGTTLNIPNISMSLGIILICSPDLYHWHLDVSWYALIASHRPKKWTPRGQSSH